jgi:hypothetical protein
MAGCPFKMRFFWQDIGTSEAGGLGIDPAQQQPGEPDFKLLLFKGFETHRPPRQARTDKDLMDASNAL